MFFKNIIHKIKNIIQFLTEHFLLFACLFISLQLLFFLVIEVFFRKMFQQTIQRSGYIWITSQNKATVLENNNMLLALFALGLLFILFYTFFYIFSYTTIYKQISLEKLSWWQLFKRSFKKLFSWQVIPYIAYLCIVILPAKLAIRIIATRSLPLPDYLLGYLSRSPILIALAIIYLLFALLLYFRLIFTLYIFIMYPHRTIIESLQESFILTSFKDKRTKRYTFLLSLGIFATFMLDYWIKTTYGLRIIEYVYQTPTGWTIIPWLFNGALLIVSRVYLFILPYISIIFIYHKITATDSTLSFTPTSNFKSLAKKTSVACAALFVVFVSITSFYKTAKHETFVISHRGDTTRAIENTLEALYEANSKNVDYVEFDIQTTKDDVYVVYHDYNVKKKTDVDGNISDFTAAEIQRLILRQGKLQAQIPSFEVYVQTAKRLDQPLLIDIKTTGNNNTKAAKNILNIINKYNFLDQVLFQSTNAGVLAELKNQEPLAQVGLIVSDNLKTLHTQSFDFYSVNRRLTNLKIYDMMKNKTVLVWTLNDEAAMQPIFDLNLDGIITDNIPIAMIKKSQASIWNIKDLFWNIFMY